MEFATRRLSRFDDPIGSLFHLMKLNPCPGHDEDGKEDCVYCTLMEFVKQMGYVEDRLYDVTHS